MTREVMQDGPGPRGGLWLRTLVFLVTLPAALNVYLPAWILWRTGAAPPASRLSVRLLALAPALVAAVIFARAVREFVVVGRGTPAPVAPPEALVVSGLYRWVRNPMYVGVLCWLAALALFFASGAIALYAAVVFAGFNAFVMGYEEPTLRRRFGAAYERYCRSVPRWLPRPPRDGAG